MIKYDKLHSTNAQRVWQELKVLEEEKTELESLLALVNSKIAVLQSKIETYERGNKIMLDYEEKQEGETPTGQFGIEPPPAKEKKGWLWGGKRTHKRRSKRLYRK